jgi:hypothetical protein
MSRSNKPRKKAKRAHAAAVAEQDDGVDQLQEPSDSGSSAISSDGQQPSAAQSVDNTALLKEITGTGRHFSKIASQYKFEANAQSYMNWTVHFQSEMDNYELADTLSEDPTNSEQDAMDPILVRHRQKTVYHMILHCVPDAQVRSVLTTALAPAEHTGFGAWRALRAHFIGDERAYLQSMESKYENFRWEESESWATMETRFESLINELEIIGVFKMDHQKKGRLMGAIQESRRRDAQGTHVYERDTNTDPKER